MTDTARESHVPRVAANPIPYWSKAGKTREVFDRAFADYQEIGFTAVKADVPEGMTSSDYLSWIEGYGLSPSLSLFSSPFDGTIRIDEEIERAKSFAATQVELGLDRTMISSMSLPARLAKPAVGADFDESRFQLVVDNVGRVCEALQGEGLRPLLHSHVGGAIETEAEITGLLDTLGADVLGFGPDTGHLRWAGVDVPGIIRRYSDRVGGIHIKDVFPDYLEPASRQGLGYRDLADTQRVWAEPGLGVIDFEAVLAAMPEGYNGDYMIEVDRPSVASAFESHQMCFEWARRALSSSRL